MKRRPFPRWVTWCGISTATTRARRAMGARRYQKEEKTSRLSPGFPPVFHIYFNGKRLAFFALGSGNQHYYWSDHLGSASVMSNSDGSSIEWESDYYPFGHKQVFNPSLDNFFLYTGYQFDYELGYNYAGAREQSPALGRFMSPDPWLGSM